LHNSDLNFLSVLDGNCRAVASALLPGTPKGLTLPLISPLPLQAAWTLVGGGQKKMNETMRDTASLIPEGVDWIHDAVAEFKPEENLIVTQSGDKV